MEPVDFDSLTNQEKLDLLDQEVKNYIQRLAKRFYIASQVDVAQVTAITEAETQYI